MAETITCPACEGSGEGGMAFVNHGDNGQGGNRCKYEPVGCHACSGRGVVDARYPEWRAAGDEMRRERLSRDVSLREEARRRGLRASELSAMEMGRVEPVRNRA